MLETVWDGSVAGRNRGLLCIEADPIRAPEPPPRLNSVAWGDAIVLACCSHVAGSVLPSVLTRSGLSYHQVAESLTRLVKAGALTKHGHKPTRYRRVAARG